MEGKTINSYLKTGISSVKGIAIISVICAHCGSVQAENVIVKESVQLLSILGGIGVLVFFTVSGMLFHYDKYSIKEFFIKKVFYLIVPWFISGTAVYLYVYLRKPPISFVSWINYIIGNGSYLYYMTVLLLFYLLFFFVKPLRSRVSLIICEAVTLVSILFFYDKIFISPYLNVFNWIGFFALGINIKENKKTFVKIFEFIKRFSGTVLLLYAVFVIYLLIFTNTGGYWGILSAPACIFGALCLAIIADFIAKKQWRTDFFCTIGDNSLFMYLWHMPIAGIVSKVMNIGFLSYGVIFRPVIVLAIMLLGLCIAQKVFAGNKTLSLMFSVRFKTKKDLMFKAERICR